MRCQKALFSAYRADQYADPEGFMVSLGAVLEQFPDNIITHVCDPRTGIQRRSKFPPTISEIIEACEAHQEHLAKIAKPKVTIVKRYYDEPRLKERPAGYMAKVFVPEGHNRYPGLVEWASTAHPVWWKYGYSSDNRTGIWVSFDAWEGRQTREL